MYRGRSYNSDDGYRRNGGYGYGRVPHRSSPLDGYSNRRHRSGRSGTRVGARDAYFNLATNTLGLNHRQALVVGAAVVACVLLAWFVTPLSDYVAALVLTSVPLEADLHLGRESWKSLRRKYPPVQDLWAVEDVGTQLLRANAHRIAPEYQFNFGVVHAPFANAFALPGGIVRVTDTLLTTLNLTPQELAALLGHEIGHVLHRHSQRRAIKHDLVQTMLDAIVYNDKDGYDESFGEAVGEIVLKSATWLGEQSFSRRDEYEADATAWELLVDSDVDPRSVQSLLQKLRSLEEGSDGTTRWESTHPGTKDRIDALSAKWDNLGWRDKRRFV